MKHLTLLALTVLLGFNAAISQSWSWTEVDVDVDTRLADVYFSDMNNGWIVGSGGVVLNTKDAGSTWTSVEDIEGLDGNDLRGVFFLDSLTGWIIGAGSNNTPLIIKTVDAGATWEVQSFEGASERLANDIVFRNDSVGWVGLFNGKIFYSENGGADWVEEDTRPSGGSNARVSQINEISVSPNRAIAGGQVSGSGTSKNYALIDRQPGPPPFWFGDFSPEIPNADRIETVHLLNDSVGFAGGLEGNIYRLQGFTNENWSVVYEVPEDVAFLRSIDFADEMNGWALANTNDASMGTIHRTTNTGDSWMELPRVEGRMLKLNAVTDGSTYRVWVVGEEGRAYVGQPETSSISNIISLQEISVYPNPVTDRFSVSLDLSQSDRYNIELYDVNGRLVRNLFNGTLPGGQSTLEFDNIDFASSGTYVLRLMDSDGGVRSVPLVVR